MIIDDIPNNVDPMVILGNDDNYLVVYTHLSNEIAIELLERSLQILKHEQQLESQSSGQLH